MSKTENYVLKMAGAIAGSGIVGFTVTRLVLEESQKRNARSAQAQQYVELLGRANRQRVEWQPTIPPVCQGCAHYHGQTYGGNRLVCAMHPYGVDTEVCPDWEEKERKK